MSRLSNGKSTVTTQEGLDISAIEFKSLLVVWEIVSRCARSHHFVSRVSRYATSLQLPKLYWSNTWCIEIFIIFKFIHLNQIYLFIILQFT